LKGGNGAKRAFAHPSIFLGSPAVDAFPLGRRPLDFMNGIFSRPPTDCSPCVTEQRKGELEQQNHDQGDQQERKV
jgi:hypothetical protein